MSAFSLYTRKKKNGASVFYVRFKRHDSSYASGISTGIIQDTPTPAKLKKSRRQAEQWAEDYLKAHGVPLKGGNTLFKDYTHDFFSFSGLWATDKKTRGLRISERHCQERTDLLKNHPCPFFGKIKLSDINRAVIKEYRNSLFQKGYSGSTINKCLSALKAILEAAEEQEIIYSIPRIDRAADSPKRKGILILDEVHRLFNHHWTTKKSFKHPARENFTGKAANRLAASTGMRAGEIQALVHSDIDIIRGVVTVRRSWDTRFKQIQKTTKTGKTRNIFIPDIVRYELEELINNHPEPGPEAFLFFSEKKPEQPTAQRVFIDALYKALAEIGIDETERQERNITFHSWRGFMNSLMINSKIPMQKVMSITGHLTPEMVQHYYTVDDM